MTKFKEEKKQLISKIKTKITEAKDVETLFKLADKLISKKEVETEKLQMEKIENQVPSLLPDDNITHKEALQELEKMVELWK
ncbi:MAG: hypothetical protein LBU44_07815 [Mediterranea sp.]|jgi:hypothetical protein|nr:hypothetical protein [Mediterranea sp.]